MAVKSAQRSTLAESADPFAARLMMGCGSMEGRSKRYSSRPLPIPNVVEFAAKALPSNVIRVKAGIHGLASLRIRPWIPACAGMTNRARPLSSMTLSLSLPCFAETVDKCEETLRQAQGERKQSFEIGLPTAPAEPVEACPEPGRRASLRRKSTDSAAGGFGADGLRFRIPPAPFLPTAWTRRGPHG
jgi:hypothetical protein